MNGRDPTIFETRNGSDNAVTRPKRPRDPAQLAKLMIDIASGEVEDREPTPEEQGKNPAAVALGQRGGRKGGLARAAKLGRRRLRAIAKKAAATRWAARTKKS